jgi:predicted ATPase
MKLTKFEIQNYKSIKKSNECWLASDITILAGKNECGKTACLEALRDFNPVIKEYPVDALPEDRGDEDFPTVKLWFQLGLKKSICFLKRLD